MSQCLTNNIPRLEGEEWREYKDFPKYYVSTKGRVFSTYKHRLLRPTINGSGYFMVELVDRDRRKLKNVHRLVAETFIPRVNGCDFVDHIDTVKTNNDISNLHWVDASGNMNNPITRGVLAKNKFWINSPGHAWGGKHIRARKIRKLSMDGVLIQVFECMAEPANTVNGCVSNLRNACIGKYSQAYGYKWEYVD